MICECTTCEEVGGKPTIYEDDGARLIRVIFPDSEMCDKCSAFKRGVEFALVGGDCIERKG